VAEVVAELVLEDRDSLNPVVASVLPLTRGQARP
jgi:hypothetical protein